MSIEKVWLQPQSVVCEVFKKCGQFGVVSGVWVVRGCRGQFFRVQAEFAAVKEESDSVVFKDTEASRCGVEPFSPTIEPFGESVTAWRSKPGQESVEAILECSGDLHGGIDAIADYRLVP